jgi:hypothetical protein
MDGNFPPNLRFLLPNQTAKGNMAGRGAPPPAILGASICLDDHQSQVILSKPTFRRNSSSILEDKQPNIQ